MRTAGLWALLIVVAGCGDCSTVHRTLFVDGAAFPGRLPWIHDENDSFCSRGHSRSNFDAYVGAL